MLSEKTHLGNTNTVEYQIAICFFLFVFTAVLYCPVSNFDFVNSDDDRYVEQIQKLEKN